jgi:hypothetical protein
MPKEGAVELYRIVVVGLLVFAVGLIWLGLCVLDVLVNAPDGPCWGRGPLLAALGVAVAGVLILVF